MNTKNSLLIADDDKFNLMILSHILQKKQAGTGVFIR
jgi:CheY-like chemotaxis protein